MCVGFTNGYSDFSSCDTAIRHMTAGSAVSFNRFSVYHFGIYIGRTLEPNGNGVPVICHFYGPADDMRIRLDDVRDIAQNCTVRVYRCNCSDAKRSRVIRDCLKAVGDGGYNALGNNCEHFVRRVINGENVSFQSVATVAAPLVQLPRLVFGSVFKSLFNSSSSSSGSSSSGSSSSGFSSSGFSSSGFSSSGFSSSSCSSSSCSSSGCLSSGCSSSGCSSSGCSSSGCSSYCACVSPACLPTCSKVYSARSHSEYWEMRKGCLALKDPNGALLVVKKCKAWQFEENSIPEVAFTLSC